MHFMDWSSHCCSMCWRQEERRKSERMFYRCTLSVIGDVTVLDEVLYLLYVICQRREILSIMLLDLEIDWDVYGRGVLEVMSIYHLWEPGAERLWYIWVTNISFCGLDCHWLDIILNIKNDDVGNCQGRYESDEKPVNTGSR
jgi:hypothetical protein